MKSTPDTTGIEEIQINWKAIAAKKLMDSGVSPKATAELILTLEGLFHQHLQKAQEDERKRILRSINDKEKQEQILANLILQIVGEENDFEISDSDLLTDYVVFEKRSPDKSSTTYRIVRNRILDRSELDQDITK